VPGRGQAIELQYLGLQHPQLGAKGGKARARHLGQPFVTGIGDQIEQLINTVASDRRDNPELGKMG
jgi:hypothetical protein